MLLENVKAKLQGECNLSSGDCIVAAVSGGADSMALLDLLVRSGYRPIVAHFNHHLRPSAELDAEFVRQAAVHYGLDFVIGSGDVKVQASQAGETLEEAARNARYRFLFSIADERNAAAVVTAHQADDQVETVLMNLLRGSGLTGLGGMRVRSITVYHAEILLVRPLLDCWRKDILEYCRMEHLEFVTDETNQDKAYRRNRIRLELIPELESYNPQIKSSLLKMSHLAAADRELLDDLLQKALSQCALKIDRAYGEIALDPFRELPLAMQRYLIRYYLETCFPEEKDLGSRQIEDAWRVLTRELKSHNQQLNDHILIRVEGTKGVFMEALAAHTPSAEWPYIFNEKEIHLETGMIDLGGRWKLKLTLLTPEECGDRYRKNEDHFQAFLNMDDREEGLVLRTWKAGDRYQPLGMRAGRIKVSDFWINQKLPLRAKEHWPLLFAGSELIWIPGFQPAESVKVTAETRRILHLSVFQN
jgi:tRNA(Ile)-lysidine synthase